MEPDIYAALFPDTVVDGAELTACTVRAASVRGDSHRHAGECRQDAVLVIRLGSGTDALLLLATADGVGSAPRSHLGAQLACSLVASELNRVRSEILEMLRQQDEGSLTGCVNTAVAKAAERLRAEAPQGGDPTDYATTLRALLVPVDPQIGARGFFSVGDGGLFRLRGGTWDQDPLTMDRAEGLNETGLISTDTQALPDSYRYSTVRVISDSQPGDVLVLCTDGLSTPLAKDPELQSFLAEQWSDAEAPGLARFLWQAQARVRSYDDDRTVICLWEKRP
ncbi:PP2C family serine/threonine-protein phosphatase [Streptomyces sp. NPDC056159]|uniref:PP2C family serine/threonine-protein phosphatase n=1 Tax=Streptomyces sp. NPDC056159 TaxID=3155537 RepID=UPI003436234A